MQLHDTDATVESVRRTLGLPQEAHIVFHPEMQTAVHGIAVQILCGDMPWDPERIGQMLTDIYSGLIGRSAEGTYFPPSEEK
jgi:hypothetical protein